MSVDKQISFAVIKRLPRYYRYLAELMENNISRISSQELSKKMNITASQIRQDLNNFGNFGQQGYGYNVEFLFHEISKLLALDRHYQLIVIGAGNIGLALANYTNFEKRGYQVIGIFDNNPNVIGKTVAHLVVADIETLQQFVDKNQVDIAVLAVPNVNVSAVASLVVQLGIKGIWNFSPVDLNTLENIQVENVHLTDSLMTLSYKICNLSSMEPAMD